MLDVLHTCGVVGGSVALCVMLDCPYALCGRDHFSIQLNSSLCFDVFSIEVFSETFSPVDVFILQILLL